MPVRETTAAGALDGADDPIAWENPDEGVSLTASEKLAADEYLAQSSRIEPELSTTMRDLEAEYGAHLEGFDYRLKTDESFYRKLATMIQDSPGVPVDDLLASMKDSVRYTFTIDGARYAESATEIMQGLRDRGLEPYGTLKNTWGSEGYQGINSNWIDPSGRIIEVQFHTPESFAAKQVTHDWYDIIRAPGSDPVVVADLIARQDEVFGSVPRPEGAENLSWESVLDEPGDVNGGAYSGPSRRMDPWGWAEARYDEFRVSTADVDGIVAHADNLTLPDGSVITRAEVEQIKHHLFEAEHELVYGDGTSVTARFDAIPEQAEAWIRLQRGEGTHLDRLFLLHELTELRYLREHPGAAYKEAHLHANTVANWSKEVGLG